MFALVNYAYEGNFSFVDINKIEKVDSILVAVGHDEYRNMKPKDLMNICNNENPVIADIKAIFDKNELQSVRTARLLVFPPSYLRFRF